MFDEMIDVSSLVLKKFKKYFDCHKRIQLFYLINRSISLI